MTQLAEDDHNFDQESGAAIEINVDMDGKSQITEDVKIAADDEEEVKDTSSAMTMQTAQTEKTVAMVFNEQHIVEDEEDERR